jgi:hypothetical protein
MADGWAFWLAEQFAQIVFVELNTTNPGRFAIWHTRNRGRDAWRNAAGTSA